MERVGALLRNMGGNEALRRRMAETRALESWADVVGAPLAGKTRPLRVAGERLLVVAHGAALRQELTFHKGTILRKFNESAGIPVAREIVFLESDANLSSLVESGTDPEADRPAHPDRDEDRPKDGSTLEPEEPDTWPVYRKFDAEAYRRELERIAKG